MREVDLCGDAINNPSGFYPESLEYHLQVVERTASSSSGAEILWADGRTVPAALELLAVPAAGAEHMQFLDPNVQRALKVRKEHAVGVTKLCIEPAMGLVVSKCVARPASRPARLSGRSTMPHHLLKRFDATGSPASVA